MSITPQSLITTKRNRQAHSAEEIRELIRLVTAGEITDYQTSAWLMAAYLNGLNDQETADLTLAMAESGDRLDLGSLPKPWVDKHSTGGVGDKTTLVVLPILAAAGATVVKMSGRGLGITGGTVDKLGSIPGFRLDLSPAEMVRQAGEIGVALTGQTPNLAPADKVLYGLRDVTATVDSLPLIVSSILSKKIAGGAETVVLDVKCGAGAFMPDAAAARNLATALRTVGERAGLGVSTAMTDMDQPLGRSIGNALEVREAIETLQNLNRGRFEHLCLVLCGLALEASGLCASGDGFSRATEILHSGLALQKAEAWITAQGGPVDFVKRCSDYLPVAPVVHKVFVHEPGWVASIDARKMGRAVVDLGGGRKTKEDVIDLAVGIELFVEVGEELTDQEHVATVHAATEEQAESAIQAVRESLDVQSTPAVARPVILEIV